MATIEEQYALVAQLGLIEGIKAGLLQQDSASATVTTAGITDATAVGRAVLTAADAATARTAIGAGTSSLTLGTGGTNAKAGNYAPTSTEVSTALKAKSQIAALATVATADATDLATAVTLVNVLKVSVNAIIAALKA